MSDWQFVPVVDITGIKECKKRQKEIANEVANACKTVGFYYIVNHGISEDLQQELETSSRKFFALEKEEKMRISMKKAGIAWRGYFPVGDELTSGRVDQKEGIYFGIDNEAQSPPLPMHGENQWPKYPPELKDLVKQYIHELIELAHDLMKVTAIGLGLSSDYFRKRFTDDPTVLFRIFNYPVHNFTEEDYEWGVREHTDMGFLTILKQDLSGGLEVKNKAGKWIAAPPIPNSFVVNIGDMLEFWTHGYYKATLHRVRNLAKHDRLSFPLFFDPNWHCALSPIQEIKHLANTEKDEGKEERWDSLDLMAEGGKSYGQFVWSKISSVFPDLATNLN